MMGCRRRGLQRSWAAQRRNELLPQPNTGRRVSRAREGKWRARICGDDRILVVAHEARNYLVWYSPERIGVYSVSPGSTPGDLSHHAVAVVQQLRTRREAAEQTTDPPASDPTIAKSVEVQRAQFVNDDDSHDGAALIVDVDNDGRPERNREARQHRRKVIDLSRRSTGRRIQEAERRSVWASAGTR